MIEDKVDRAVKAGNSGNTTKAKEVMASFQIKKYKVLVIRAWLKRISSEATNMAQELRADELRHAVHRYIVSVKSLDGHYRITNETICDYFVKLLPREPILSSAQFDT